MPSDNGVLRWTKRGDVIAKGKIAKLSPRSYPFRYGRLYSNNEGRSAEVAN
jgi:hypothetical protein